MQTAKVPKPTRRIIIGVPLIIFGALGGFALWASLTTNSQPLQEEKIAPKIKTVTALGYLEPQGKIIKLSAPSSSNGNSRVEKLLVEEGDTVKTGQVIAILDSRARLQASLIEAQEQVKVAQSNLEVVRAGAKKGEIKSQQAVIARLKAQQQGEIQAQRATVDRLTAEVQNAHSELERYEMLYKEGGTSASLKDAKGLTLATAQKNLQQAQAILTQIQTTRYPELEEAIATLEKIAEVRSVDISASQAQVNKASATVQQVKAQLELAYVNSPQAGVILTVNTRPGELISTDGIVEVGQTNHMRAVLEVVESNIANVKKGQKVKLFADSQPNPLRGEVVEIGVKVQRQNVVNSDTSANIDARIIEVRVQLDQESVQQVKGLTNLQVTGEIKL